MPSMLTGTFEHALDRSTPVGDDWSITTEVDRSPPPAGPGFRERIAVGDLVDGRFEVVKLIRKGGMGRVYRGLDHVSGQDVAVKVLRASRQHRERFRREASVLALLRHPFIVGHVAHGDVTGSLSYLVMSWLDGEDLRDRLERRTRLSVEESVRIGRCIAQAIVEAHRQGVIHRDIKPSNVFLVRRDAACSKLLDFGIARLARDAGMLTGPGQTLGTPAYMSPEQARGDLSIDGQADVFSLGCLLYHCLVGVAPFRGGTPSQVLTRVILDTAPPIRAIRHGVPRALDQLVMQMLAKEPSERPSTRTVATELAGITRRLRR